MLFLYKPSVTVLRHTSHKHMRTIKLSRYCNWHSKRHCKQLSNPFFLWESHFLELYKDTSLNHSFWISTCIWFLSLNLIIRISIIKQIYLFYNHFIGLNIYEWLRPITKSFSNMMSIQRFIQRKYFTTIHHGYHCQPLLTTANHHHIVITTTSRHFIIITTDVSWN